MTRPDHHVVSHDGEEIGVRWYEATSEREGRAAVVYLHGGGTILRSVDGYDH